MRVLLTGLLPLLASCTPLLGWEDKHPPDTSAGCADESVEQIYGSDMVGCDGEVTQPEAESLCETGWHLCSFDEFASRGGDAVSATPQGRWLRACVRDFHTDPMTCPTSMVCPDCAGIDDGTPVSVTWNCEDPPVSLETVDHGRLGVVTTTTSPARHVGCESSQCVYATARNCALAQYGATCCR